MQDTFRFKVPIVVIDVERQISLHPGHSLGGDPATPEQTADIGS